MRSIKRDQATLKIERAKYVKLMLETKGVDVTLGYQRKSLRQRRSLTVMLFNLANQPSLNCLQSWLNILMLIHRNKAVSTTLSSL
jgi:hypothetical protein